MAEFKASKLEPGSHILIDQPLLRLPSELSRNNLKSAQYQIESTQRKVNTLLQSSTKTVLQQSTLDDPTAAALTATQSLNQTLSHLQTLKKKLQTLNTSSQDLHKQSVARIQHLEELYEIPSLADVKYEDWSRVRLDRLLVDYLLRMGYTGSARQLSEEKGIEALVDLDEFESVGRIERSLRVERRVDVALNWCARNSANLKKMNNNNSLEYELRLQQFIELVRAGFATGEMRKFHDARTHAGKYLASHPDPKWKSQAAVLLVIEPNTTGDPYDKLYSDDRWAHLAHLFLDTHHTMFSLPSRPLLHMALTAGLSALKTPACHSKFVSPSSGLNSSASPSHRQNGDSASPQYEGMDSMDDILNGAEAGTSSASGMSLTTSVCPICSTELNQLARRVPFAHHTKSNVEHDPVVLPNGRIYGRERLMRLNEKLGTPEGLLRDPVDISEVYRWEDVSKVYIS